MGITPKILPRGLTSTATFLRCLLLRVTQDKSTEEVEDTVQDFQAPTSYQFIMWANTYINTTKADAGSQLTSKKVTDACVLSKFGFSLEAPYHQEHIHTAERTWQFIHALTKSTKSMMVHVWLSNVVFSVLPIACLGNKVNDSTTKYMKYLWQGTHPRTL
jgi:hypothetical protein